MLYLKRKLMIATAALGMAAGVCCVERSSQSAAAPPSGLRQSSRPAVREGQGFANPLNVMLADPYIFHEKNEYYLFGTAGSGGTSVWTSQNLIDWKFGGASFERSSRTYSRRHFWAPEMFKHNGRYYLHFTASSSDVSQRLVLCDADSPTGPFKEFKAPWFRSPKAVIDGNVFRDDDGKMYLYYVLDCSENGTSDIYVRRLNEKLDAEDAAHLCIKPSQSWEGKTWNEAPTVIKHGDVYYLMYSANYFGERDYAVGYATSSSPLGPWKKAAENPVLAARASVSGPGHNSAIDSPDGKELFIAYHTHQQASGQGWHRQLALDRVRFVDAGRGKPARLKVDGPTMSLQAMPSGAKHRPAAKSDEFDSPIDFDQWVVMSELPGNWDVDDGTLRLRGVDGDIAGDRADIRNLFMQYAPLGDFDAVAKVTIHPIADYEQAFLTVMQDHNRFVKISTVWSKGGPKFEFASDIDGVYKFELTENKTGDTSYLKVSRRGDRFSAFASGDGTNWITLKRDFVLPLVNTRIGIAAGSPGSERPVDAAFDFFHVEPVLPPVDPR